MFVRIGAPFFRSLFEIGCCGRFFFIQSHFVATDRTSAFGSTEMLPCASMFGVIEHKLSDRVVIGMDFNRLDWRRHERHLKQRVLTCLY